MRNYFNIFIFIVGLKPDFILGCLLTQKQMAGDHLTDSYKFKHYNLTNFNFVLNSQQIPRIPYKMNWKDGEKSCSRVFFDCYNAINLHHLNESILLSKESFEDMFMICSDLTPSNNALTSLNSEISFANLGVDMVFSESLKESLTLLLFCIVQSKFRINSNRQCEVDY